MGVCWHAVGNMESGDSLVFLYSGHDKYCTAGLSPTPPLTPLVQVFLYSATTVFSTQAMAVTVFLYSGHDSTVLPLLAALGLEMSEWPPYMSNIVFELWKLPDASGQHVVREVATLKTFKEEVVGPFVIPREAWGDACHMKMTHADPAPHPASMSSLGASQPHVSHTSGLVSSLHQTSYYLYCSIDTTCPSAATTFAAANNYRKRGRSRRSPTMTRNKLPPQFSWLKRIVSFGSKPTHSAAAAAAAVGVQEESEQLLGVHGGARSATVRTKRVEEKVEAHRSLSQQIGHEMYAFFFTSRLNVLLVFLPVAFVSKYMHWGDGATFVFSMLALTPLAEDCPEQGLLRVVPTLSGVSVNCGLLTLAVVAVLLPSLLSETHTLTQGNESELMLSRFESVLLLACYVLFLVFQLFTHR
eukprot:gene32705-17136_t